VRARVRRHDFTERSHGPAASRFSTVESHLMTATSHLAPRPAGNRARLSFAQELLWLLDRATPGLTAYNVPRAFRIRGALNISALNAAITYIASRHEILRTTYGSDAAGSVQIIHPAAPVTVVEISSVGTSEPDRANVAERFFLAQARTPFDLAHDRPLRAHLLSFAADDHVLVLVTHHIASDGWSKGVMFRELSAAYNELCSGRSPALSPLPVQYADFAEWQRDQVDNGSLAEHLEYWHERLSAPLPNNDLATEFPRPSAPSFEGGREMLVLPTALATRLRDAGMAQGATLYMVLLAAYHTVLYRYSGNPDILTGSPTASRNIPEVEDLIGYFANTLAMRTNFEGNPSLSELVERIAENAVEAFEHEEVPFEKLVLEIRDQHTAPSHAPLFSCVLTMEDTLPDALQMGATSVEPIAIDFGMAKFDLTLLVAVQPEGLRLALWYRSDLFSPAYARRFLGHMQQVLEAIANGSSQRVNDVSLLSAAEHDQRQSWNATSADEGSLTTVVALFEQQVSRVPDRTAVWGDEGAVTYQQLNARANQLARRVAALGAKPGDAVGLLLDRSSDAIVALMGILKSGAAYMPMSVDAPASRLAQQLAESGVTIVVTHRDLAGRLPTSVQRILLDADTAALNALDAGNLGSAIATDSPAYVLFTSGSTGVPKGVAVSHANIVHYTRAISRVLADMPAARGGDGLSQLDGKHFGLVSTLAADLGNTVLYPSLLAGGTLHTLTSAITTEPARFAEYVQQHPLDVLKATPNHYLALAAGKTGQDLAAVLPRLWLILGGEPLRLEVARVLVGTGRCRVLNHYGPTETTVGVCTLEVTTSSLGVLPLAAAQSVPVGRPLVNTTAFVVDAHGNEQPVGIPGELLLGGAGVALGYINRPELTAERFMSFRGTRCYRSGDRVRRHADGSIEFLGRTDDQVKVRGYRVELGEIEQVLREHPGIVNAAVVLRTTEDGSTQLIAYGVAKADGYAVSHNDRASAETLSAWMSAHLPDYMVPQHLVLLDSLPLTPNGKIDKARLPKPEEVADQHVGPRTITEDTIARIWREVLKRDQVGVRDRFLDLGGHSLLAIRVLGRISKELGVRLALRSLFETPTIEQLAAIVDSENAAKQVARQQLEADEALNSALSAVENLTDEEVTQMLGGDASTQSK